MIPQLKCTASNACFADSKVQMEKWRNGLHPCVKPGKHLDEILYAQARYELASVFVNLRSYVGNLVSPRCSANEWKNSMRKVTAGSLIRNPMLIGGPGRAVEIGEGLFSKRSMSVGCTLDNASLVACVEKQMSVSWRSLRLQELNVLPVIQRYIPPGSTAASDQ
ncbi:hypothetical protein D918_08859 [Trichuris suis]|nr:hypothetical protein D918_08859 [Trichuris suis]